MFLKGIFIIRCAIFIAKLCFFCIFYKIFKLKYKKINVNLSKRETHLKTSSSNRAVVDYDVDRTVWKHDSTLNLPLQIAQLT